MKGCALASSFAFLRSFAANRYFLGSTKQSRPTSTPRFDPRLYGPRSLRFYFTPILS